MVVKIAVVGAGVIGLSTALNVQTRIPGAEVKVIAEKFNRDITSFGSGGLWIPSHGTGKDSKLRKWCEVSWDFYRLLVTGPEAGMCGACISNGYVVTRAEYPEPLFKDYATVK